MEEGGFNENETFNLSEGGSMKFIEDINLYII